MIKAVEDAFTIIHIRISNVKVLGICARHFVTGAVVFFIVINAWRIFVTMRNIDILGFIESSILIILTLYFCLAWVISWPKAGKLLNKAVEYEEEYKKK